MGRLHRLLLAAVFCVVACATCALTMPQPADGPAMVASTAPCAAPDDTGGDGGSSGQWRAASRAKAAISESVWHLPLVHAGLAGARCDRLFEAVPAPPRRHCSYRRPPDHRPLRTPLLI